MSTYGRYVRQRLQRFSSDVVQDTFIASVDQILLSAANLAVGLLLIRYAPATQYALYVLAYSVILLATNVQNAIVTTQMSVLAPQYEPSKRLHFVAALATAQYLIWLPLCFLIIGFALLGYQFRLGVTHIDVILAITIASPCVLLREFVRRAFLVYMLPGWVLLVDLLYTGILLVWVYVIAAMPESAAMMTIVAVGGAGLLAGIWGGMLFNSRVGWRWCLDFTALTTTWRQGKWALLGVIVVWLQNQGFLYLLNSLMGKVEVGNVSAIRLLLMPIVVMITSVGLILKPRGAEWLVSGNKRRLFWVTGGLTAGMVLVALVYIGGVFSVQKMIMDLLFKKTIADIDYLLPLWGLVFVLQIVRTNISTLFQIFQRFDILFYIGLVTAIVSLITGYWGILTMGVIGSLFGLILGEVMYLLGCVMVYIFDQRRRNMTLQTISWDHV